MSKRKLIIGGIAAFLVIGAIGSATGSDTDTASTTPTATPTSPAVAEATADPVATEAPVATQAPAATEAPEAGDPVAELWTLDTIKDRTASHNFREWEKSPLADGTPRWMTKRADSSMVEAIGSDQDHITSVSLVVGVTPENAEAIGQLTGAFLNTWAPGTNDKLAQVIDTNGTSFDETIPFSGGTVRAQALGLDDGALVTISIERA